MKSQFCSPAKKEGGVKLILRMKRHSPVLDDVLAKGRDAQQVRLKLSISFQIQSETAVGNVAKLGPHIPPSGFSKTSYYDYGYDSH